MYCLVFVGFVYGFVYLMQVVYMLVIFCFDMKCLVFWYGLGCFGDLLFKYMFVEGYYCISIRDIKCVLSYFVGIGGSSVDWQFCIFNDGKVGFQWVLDKCDVCVVLIQDWF